MDVPSETASQARPARSHARIPSCNASAASQLAAHLARFKLRARVGVADASADWAVWTRTPQGCDAPPPEPDARAAAEGWRRDPRLAVRPQSSHCAFYRDSSSLRLAQELGWRALLPRGSAPADAASDGGAYAYLRLALGVAEGAELAGELPLELNLDGLGAVSFTKGCYVGQELTSRTHFRGVIRKRAMPVTFAALGADAAVPPGAQLLSAAGGAAVGRVLAARGDMGVALLRLAAAMPPAPGSVPRALVVEASNIATTPARPRWWPQAWGTES